MKSFELGTRVQYMRMNHETGELIFGEGVVVGKVIGIIQRINYQVMEGKRAYNVEPEAINCTVEEKAAYIAHNKRINDFIAAHTKDAEKQVAAANQTIEAMNTEFFGAKVPMDEVVTDKPDEAAA